MENILCDYDIFYPRPDDTYDEQISEPVIKNGYYLDETDNDLLYTKGQMGYYCKEFSTEDIMIKEDFKDIL